MVLKIVLRVEEERDPEGLVEHYQSLSEKYPGDKYAIENEWR